MTQADAREGQAGLTEVSERPIVPWKPVNAGGGKGPQFKVNVRSGESREIGMSLIPPLKVQKLQATLHAKAKSAPSYRFDALYDRRTGGSAGWTNWRKSRLWHRGQPCVL